MITHVIVELKKPVKEEYFHMDTVLPSEYYGYGTPLIWCKDCIHYRGHRNYCENDMFAKEDGFCNWAERKDK